MSDNIINQTPGENTSSEDIKPTFNAEAMTEVEDVMQELRDHSAEEKALTEDVMGAIEEMVAEGQKSQEPPPKYKVPPVKTTALTAKFDEFRERMYLRFLQSQKIKLSESTAQEIADNVMSALKNPPPSEGNVAVEVEDVEDKTLLRLLSNEVKRHAELILQSTTLANVATYGDLKSGLIQVDFITYGSVKNYSLNIVLNSAVEAAQRLPGTSPEPDWKEMLLAGDLNLATGLSNEGYKVYMNGNNALIEKVFLDQNLTMGLIIVDLYEPLAKEDGPGAIGFKNFITGIEDLNAAKKTDMVGSGFVVDALNAFIDVLSEPYVENECIDGGFVLADVKRFTTPTASETGEKKEETNLGVRIILEKTTEEAMIVHNVSFVSNVQIREFEDKETSRRVTLEEAKEGASASFISIIEKLCPGTDPVIYHSDSNNMIRYSLYWWSEEDKFELSLNYIKVLQTQEDPELKAMMENGINATDLTAEELDAVAAKAAADAEAAALASGDFGT